MRVSLTFVLFTLLISFVALESPVAAHFFPNISSIPPSLVPNNTWGVWNDLLKLSGCRFGQKIDGLSKLKKYFEHFGYLGDNNVSFSNFTDDFDDTLQSAIKKYQLNFNLNTTGVLDVMTLKQIVMPRCGVADLINGSSSMNYGKAPNPNPKSNHIHSVAHYSFFPGRPRWPPGKTELTYAFLPQNQLTASARTVFENAFGRWSEVTPLTFTETQSYRTADIRIGFFTGDHGDGEPFDGALGTLAHAFSPPSGWFHLDGDENWVIDAMPLGAAALGSFDLESVAVHEIGHLLGLGHSSIEDAIMFPALPAGARKVTLANDDVTGVQELYGSNPNYNGSTVSLPPNQERDTSSGSRVLGGFREFTFVTTIGLILLIIL